MHSKSFYELSVTVLNKFFFVFNLLLFTRNYYSLLENPHKRKYETCCILQLQTFIKKPLKENIKKICYNKNSSIN